VSLTDFAWKIVLTRLGQRLRVAGTAELTGWDTSLNPTRCEALTARTLGWTMACGSARGLADVVAGRKPDVEFKFTGA
jgi:D-amino-acid dehydrogenase